MPRATIRFPDDLHAAITAEVERKGKPWTFSSVAIDLLEFGIEHHGGNVGRGIANPAVVHPDYRARVRAQPG